MATYKVLQDIEAEDKLLGPLTLKQFVFAGITIVIGFIQFKLITAPGSFIIKLPFVLLFLIPMAIFGFLAAPIGRDQPNDVWLLARLRFYFKPHKRIWDQNGMSNLVTITAPKHVETHFASNLSQTEVKSRLQALANTIDSRGWAVKNVNVNLYNEPGYLAVDATDDRLVAPSSLPQDVPVADVAAADDIMDPTSNPTAQLLDQMMNESAQKHLSTVTSQLHRTAPSGMSTFDQTQVVTPGSTDDNSAQPTADDQAVIARADDSGHSSGWAGHRTIMPGDEQKARDEREAAERALYEAERAKQTTETAAPNPAILGLANNDDLNVATIARQANRLAGAQSDDGEVVISLH